MTDSQKKPTSIHLTPAQLARLQAEAARKGVSVSAVARWAVDYLLPPPPQT